MKAKKRKLVTSTPPPPPPLTTISSLPDDIVADILLRLPSAASIARALFASKHWWRVACSPTFFRRLRAVHAYPLLLGHFAAQASSPLPLFHPARLHSDSVLAAMVRRGDFFLTRLQVFGRCTLEDSRDGLLLFSSRTKLIVFDPVGHHTVPIRRPPRRSFPYHGYAAHTFCFFPDITTGGAEAECFRVVSLQHRRQSVRAEVFDYGTRSWTIHPGTALRPARSHGNQLFPAMHAAGRIYWKYRTEPILLALDAKTMRFLYVRTPPGVTSRSPYAVGERDDGACCLVHVAHGAPDGCPRLQVWLHCVVGGNEVEPWVLVRDEPLRLRSALRGRVRQVRAVAGGVVLLCFTGSSAHLPHVAFRLKNLKVEAEFTCRGSARPYLLQ
ncbi:hypothetical protein E2562_017482 [Oryza meyeriana var. granulata]|uniref:F-box protein AT5G49610-like beta-propeller domain-containing protein n=1 Tax=Oryza meyeriana var. granulata TaxID=110450 RepID=A0A6G1DY46_9ORYZ|nr:hypothetical protein E2562_017482 [Oryza meyeriana var. granulata]